MLLGPTFPDYKKSSQTVGIFYHTDSWMGHTEELVKKTAVIPKCKVDPAIALTIYMTLSYVQARYQQAPKGVIE